MFYNIYNFMFSIVLFFGTIYTNVYVHMYISITSSVIFCYNIHIDFS